MSCLASLATVPNCGTIFIWFLTGTSIFPGGWLEVTCPPSEQIPRPGGSYTVGVGRGKYLCNDQRVKSASGPTGLAIDQLVNIFSGFRF